MNKKSKKELLLLGTFGFLGVLSLLLSKITIPEEALKALPPEITESQLKLLLLVNPTILLILSLIVGYFFSNKLALKTCWQNKKEFIANSKVAIVAGIFSAIFLLILEQLFKSSLPQSYFQFAEQTELNPITRIFYGGITEEIIIRFGLMSFLAWIFIKIFKNKKASFILAIILSAAVFALLHFPVLQLSLPSLTLPLITFIFTANFILGSVYGYLYWKKGLYSSVIAHIFTHLTLIAIINCMS